MILDVMLPDGSGFDLCAQIRGRGIDDADPDVDGARCH